MTELRLLQNFNGGRAIMVTDRASSLEVLMTSLNRLGVGTDPADIFDTAAAIDATTLQPDRDIIFIDGDINDVTMLPLSPIGKLAPAPIIGMLGVSAPSRLKALMRAGATSFLRKPIHGAAVYPALFVGVNEHRRHRHLEALLEGHEHRRRGRRDVVKAIIRTMAEHGIDDDEAYDLLRRRSMKMRQPVEDYCKDLVRSADGQEHGECLPRRSVAD